MEGLILRRLDSKQILRISQMQLKIRGKLTQILKHPRKRLPVHLQDGVLRIHHVEGNRAVIHVDNDFN